MKNGGKRTRRIYFPKESKVDVKTNYIGLIIGPRGANQKMLEKKTGAKIVIRGKFFKKTGKWG